MSDLREVFWVEPRAAVNERAEIVLRQQDEHPVAGLERPRKRVLMHDSRIYRLLSGMDPLRDHRGRKPAAVRPVRQRVRSAHRRRVPAPRRRSNLRGST